MAITAPEPRHARQVIHDIIPAPLPERPRHIATPRRRRKQTQNSSLRLLASICIVFFTLLILFLLGRDRPAVIHEPAVRRAQSNNDNRISIKAANVDSVVRYLMKLAEMPPDELWHVFGMDSRSGYGQDQFSLSILESGGCPSDIPTTLKWLPPRPLHSSHLSSTFQSIQSTTSKRRKQKPARKPSEPSVIVWYEHISKAGGTTFCALANSNMRKSSVPRYHCMPRKGNLMDGRVGSWSNDELVEFINENEYKIVANEWDPFDVDKLKLSGRDLYGSNNSHKKRQSEWNSQSALLFVTTLRDPADRLLSSYTFFSDNSEDKKRTPTNFGTWMKNNLRRVGNFKIGQKTAFRSNIARNNYMVWRFSGGNIPNLHDDESIFSSKSQIFPSTVTDKSVWEQPFEVAVRSLSQHDLILPMDVMTELSGKESLQQILGWTQFAATGRGIVGEKESGHVVTTGEVRNSNAKSYLEERGSGNEFKALWERNWLDYILWYWARAVFFTRLYCNVE